MGVCKVSMTYRFAGLHNPTEAPASIGQLMQVPKPLPVSYPLTDRG